MEEPCMDDWCNYDDEQYADPWYGTLSFSRSDWYSNNYDEDYVDPGMANLVNQKRNDFRKQYWWWQYWWK